MVMSVKDFLLLYFRQKHFDGMPDAVRARFDDYAKNDDFVGDMKAWKRDLLENDGKTNKDLPDPKRELDESGWESLFRSFQNAFIGMSAARESFKDKKVITDFLDTYFGDARTHLFSLTEIDSDVITTLNSFISTIIKDPGGFALLGDMFDDDFDEYKNFVKSLDKGEYRTKPDIRKKLNRVISSLSRRLEWGEVNDEMRAKLESLDLNKIINGFNAETVIDARKLKAFKDALPKLLNILHDYPKIYEEFKQHDNKKISGQLDEAIKQTDYTGKINEKDFVAEKRKDDPSLLQRYEKRKENTYKSVFRKYMTAHHDRVFFGEHAKTIFDALDSTEKGIKPTDGIEGILKNGADIVKKLKIKSPNAAAHFEWFTQTMEALQSKIPDAYKGALRNGHQMNRLVSEMSLMAVEQAENGDADAIKKAKTAMELLMTMRYGLFTSRTMDAIGNIDFNIFSDKGLSWNSNEGVRFVTTLFDKTLKFGIMAGGYIATDIINRFRRIGTSFGNSGALKKKSDTWKAMNAANKAAEESEIRRINKDANREKRALLANKKSLKAAMKTALGKSSSDPFRLTEAEKYLRTQRQAEDNQRTATEAQQTLTDNAKSKYLEILAVNKDYMLVESAQLKLKKHQKYIDDLKAELEALPATATDKYQETLADTKKQEWTVAQTELKRLSDELVNTTKTINAKYSTKGTTLAAERKRVTTVPTGGTKTPSQEAYDNFKTEEGKLATEQSKLSSLESNNNTLEQQISEYKYDSESIDAINKEIKSRNETVAKWDENHKNQYAELMAFWDYIQTGDTRNIIHFSTRKLQERMSKVQDSGKTKMEELYEKWKLKRSYGS